MQLICQMDQIFTLTKCNLWLCTYEILATGPNCGLIEVVSNALSIHGLKEKMGEGSTLLDYFNRQFGPKNGEK
jgi:phosphatidylinositol 4-kinase B